MNPKTNQYERKLDQICLIFKNEEGFLQDFSGLWFDWKEVSLLLQKQKSKAEWLHQVEKLCLKGVSYESWVNQ